MKTTTSTIRTSLRTVRSRLGTALLLGGTLALGVLGPASQAQAATYCQQNGHGATGCNLGGNDNTGVCAASNWSPTGYVCREAEATEAPQDHQLDPVDPNEDDWFLDEEAAQYEEEQYEEPAMPMG